jgi:hypothetical protein
MSERRDSGERRVADAERSKEEESISTPGWESREPSRRLVGPAGSLGSRLEKRAFPERKSSGRDRIDT